MMCRFKKSVGLALAAVGLVFAQDPLHWENLYPAYSGLAFGAGKFAAVSSDGLIKTTKDGAAELSQTFVRDVGWVNGKPIYATTFGGNMFVAMQAGSTYLNSTNGVKWNLGPLNMAATWKYVVYGDQGFVAVDNEYNTALLREGGEWVNASTYAADSLLHVAFGNGRYVIAGNGINSSANALGWGGSGITAQVSVVAFGANKFVALAKGGSAVYTSPDGTRDSWQTAQSPNVPAGMADMVFGGDKFVAVGASGKGCVSGDGSAWTQATGLNPADDFKAVKYGNGIFLALGAKGSVYKSTDGASWSRLAGHSVGSYKQIVSNGSGKFVAVGDSGVSVSSDGRNWERKGSLKALEAVAFGDGKFVAVGGSKITASADGETWSEYTSESNYDFTSVAYGKNKFVVGGKNPGAGLVGQSAVILTSGNGAEWSEEELTGWTTVYYPVSLCFGGGKFLAAVGSSSSSPANRMLKVSDSEVPGKFWSNVDAEQLPDGYRMVSVAFSDNQFVAVGRKQTDEAVVLNSGDAASWQAKPVQETVKGVRSATYAKNFYIAAADSGNIYAYINNTWVLQYKATRRNLYTIYSSGNAVIAAGADGALLYSEAVPVSVRYASAPRGSASPAVAAMSLERAGGASTVTLSFTPDRAGTIAVYSLNGKLLYRARLGIGERSARLPGRALPNGSVIVRYSGGGKAVSQRFQFVR